MRQHPLAGVYAASITPLNNNGSPAVDDIPEYLGFLARRGCHGALLLGTTGEGPSFSVDERLQIFSAAVKVRETYPEFRLLAGTGTPSLKETILLSKAAFDLGFNAVVVLPPYYFHQASGEGIHDWFKELILKAVPEDGYLLGYHFPIQSGVPIPIETISTLTLEYPKKFAGFKDSTKESAYTFQIVERFSENVLAFVGNDRNLSKALQSGGAGCITAMANLFSPTLREIWNCHLVGEACGDLQQEINRKKTILEAYQPYASTIKALVSKLHGFPSWAVHLPLTPMLDSKANQLLKELERDQKGN